MFIKKKLLTGSLAVSALLITPAVLAVQSDDSASDQKPKSHAEVVESTSEDSGNHSTVKLNINGVETDVPDNGQIKKSVTSDGQTTDISVDSTHNSYSNGGTNSNHSSVNISVDSN